jgi:hypothetical protein
MKKGNRQGRVAEALARPFEEDDDMLPEYDFSKAEPAQYWKKLQEGDKFFVNDVLHVKGAGRAHVRVDTTNPALFAAKLELANRLYELNAENHWRVTQLAAAIQASHRKAKLLLFGELETITVDQLVGWLKNVGFETRIDVSVTPPRSANAKSLGRPSKKGKRSGGRARSAVA